MLKGADISKDGLYRYSLYRLWDTTMKFVLFIGLNPSTADAETDDPTIRRLSAFAESWGYGGFYIGNLFALRTSNPTELYKTPNPFGEEDNLRIVMDMFDFCDKVIFMWGAHGSYLKQDKVFINAFPKAYCFKKSSRGFPYHPLYLPSDTKPIKF